MCTRCLGKGYANPRPLDFLKSILKLIRWPNLIIAAFAQFLIYYRHIARPLNQENIGRTFDFFHVSLFIICTVIITAIGNIINDIYDIETDRINGITRNQIGKGVSIKAVYILALVLFSIGGIIATYLAYFIDQPQWFFFYPASIFILWVYNWKMKGIPLLGNIIIALLCSMTLIIVVLLEQDGLSMIRNDSKEVWAHISSVFLFFGVFAFLATWLRELIKDMEDFDGDHATGWQTYPVKFGLTASSKLGIFLVLLNIASLWLWLKHSAAMTEIVYLILLVALPLIFVGHRLLFLQNDKTQFTRLKNIMKAVFLSGILFLLII